MTLGETIKCRRKKLGMTREELADSVGVSPALIGKIENNQLKNGPSGIYVKKIAEILCDPSIRFAYLREDPIYQDIIPELFPSLNNIKTDPQTIFDKLKEELREGFEAADILATVFLHKNPQLATPNFREVLLGNLEQIVDALRCGETLFVKLIEQGIITEHDRREVHIRQQQKCIDQGHHVPDQQEAV